MSAEIDYAQEGRLLLERVNLQLDGKPERYANTNPLYQHPSGGTLFVGNCTASTSRPILDSLNITRVVYCQEGGEGAKPFMADPNFCYLDFPIGKWRSLVKRQPEAVLAFFTPLFQFVDEELAAGRSVLVHCLAGAHRAGTAGVSCLMHLLKIRAPEATRMAKTLRPAINPIGDFPALLDLLEKGMEQAGQQLE